MTIDLTTIFDPGDVSEETAAFNAKLEAELAEMPRPNAFPADVVRQARAEGRGALPLQGPEDASTWQEIPGGTGKVRVSEPDGPPRGVYLHIHGGGWTVGQPDHYDRPNLALARATGLRVVSVLYRLAPEHPWPTPKEDCLAAARWVLESTDLPIAIGGESAGGHLTAVTALALRDAGLADRLRALVLNYGVFDMRLTPSAMSWGERYLVLSTPVIGWFVDNVDPGGTFRGTAEMSPLLADLSGLPPALLQIGTEDPLLDDTLFMASRYQAAGNETKLAVYPGGIHAFDAFDLQISRDFVRTQREFLSAAFA